MTISKVGVIGAGTMGNGIAQVFAQSGFDVTMVDIKQDFVDRGMANIRKNLDKMVQKSVLPKDQADEAFKRIKTSLAVKDLKDSNFIVEVIIEDLTTKKNLFKELDAITVPDVILASNTSSISITELAAVTKRPTQVIGMHFMNPVPLMKLVEVVKGLVTSQATIDAVNDLCKKLGKTPVEVNDAPGFVANRILLPMINEAIYTLMEGVATKEAIDEVMKLGMNHPMGPLALADLIGLDVCLAILEVLHTGLGDTKYRPCPLLKKMVAAGHLGRKAKKGFYEYQ
ncbi:MAG: 3-hydroxybutyryl-CoA dehydrogenase [Planctomycetes bacterium]|nr:3-hydroxybutyryl-CoA dehydrogenase [Planctomycetota bacterium]